MKKNRDEKLLYNINRAATKIFISSCKIGKYDYLTGEKVLPPHQYRIIEQVKFTYSLLGKVLAKQVKTIDEQGENKFYNL